MRRRVQLPTDLAEDEAQARFYTFDDDPVLVICGRQTAGFDDFQATQASQGR